MEKLDIDYSLKNIAIPPNESYLIKLVEKTESVVNEWVGEPISSYKKSNIWGEGFGFTSKSTPLQGEHMETFEKEFLEIITNIEFGSVKDTFQKKLKEDIS